MGFSAHNPSYMILHFIVFSTRYFLRFISLCSSVVAIDSIPSCKGPAFDRWELKSMHSIVFYADRHIPMSWMQVMQKVYALLLAELRKLGATIVFSDFSRIIIATGKHHVTAAQGYCEYLLKTLKSRYFFCPIYPTWTSPASELLTQSNR